MMNYERKNYAGRFENTKSFIIHNSFFIIPPCIPEQPGRRSRAAPALSLKLRREALAGAVDPVTALPSK